MTTEVVGNCGFGVAPTRPQHRDLILSLLKPQPARRLLLRQLVARYVTDQMVADIAREHARGRRLLIATTNLDAERPVVWDIADRCAAAGLDVRPQVGARPASVLMTLEDLGGKTRMTVRATPYNASAVEIQTFADGFGSMKQGFTGTWDQLEAYLKTL